MKRVSEEISFRRFRINMLQKKKKIFLDNTTLGSVYYFRCLFKRVHMKTVYIDIKVNLL